MGIAFNWETRQQKEDYASWSYGGFMRFRERIAEHYGINLKEMEGFCENGKSWSDKLIGPMVLFLHHSDCDGEIASEKCGEIAAELMTVIESWDDHDYDKQQGKVLVQNLKRAHATNVPLIFA